MREACVKQAAVYDIASKTKQTKASTSGRQGVQTAVSTVAFSKAERKKRDGGGKRRKGEGEGKGELEERKGEEKGKGEGSKGKGRKSRLRSLYVYPKYGMHLGGLYPPDI